MKAKRFSHFMAYWQQMARIQNQKSVSDSDRRVAKAKSTLKALGAR